MSDANEGLTPTVPGESVSTIAEPSPAETGAPDKSDISDTATDGAKTADKKDEQQDGMVPTIDEDADEGTDGDTDGDGETDTKPEGDTDGEQDEKRLDQHPRFKEVIAQKNEAKQRAEQAEKQFADLKREIDTLKQSVQRPRQDTAPKPNYSNVMDMDRGAIIDQFNEDPHSFLSNLAQQIRAEVSGEITKDLSAKEQRQQQKQTLSSYARENDDFVPMYESGELQKFINDNRHMRLDLISAHKLLTTEKRATGTTAEMEKKIKDLESKMEKAVKEAEEKGRQKAEDNFRAKQNLRSTRTTATRRTGKTDNELKDTKTTGGRDATIAERLRKLRRGSG